MAKWQYGDGWQPIETAPENEMVLIWDGEHVYTASYEYKHEMQTQVWLESNDFWISDVTHWMPLPEPPNT
jgi:Protein of unknown function (DUF551)